MKRKANQDEDGPPAKKFRGDPLPERTTRSRTRGDTRAAPVEEVVRCTCGVTDDASGPAWLDDNSAEINWVQCERCFVWVHPECVGHKGESAFTCAWCGGYTEAAKYAKELDPKHDDPELFPVRIPVGWASAVTAEGKVYYYNVETRESKWSLSGTIAERAELAATEKLKEDVAMEQKESRALEMEIEASVRADARIDDPSELAALRECSELFVAYHFCRCFSKPLELDHFFPDELEAALLSTGPHSLLAEIHERLLCCLLGKKDDLEDWIASLKELLGARLRPEDDPLSGNMSYWSLGALSKVDILCALCEWATDRLPIKKIIAEEGHAAFQGRPIGRDRHERKYYYLGGDDSSSGRLVREAAYTSYVGARLMNKGEADAEDSRVLIITTSSEPPALEVATSNLSDLKSLADGLVGGAKCRIRPPNLGEDTPAEEDDVEFPQWVQLYNSAKRRAYFQNNETQETAWMLPVGAVAISYRELVVRYNKRARRRRAIAELKERYDPEPTPVVVEAPRAVLVDGEERVPQQILASRRRVADGQTEYLVRWEECESADDSWAPREHVSVDQVFAWSRRCALQDEYELQQHLKETLIPRVIKNTRLARQNSYRQKRKIAREKKLAQASADAKKLAKSARGRVRKTVDYTGSSYESMFNEVVGRQSPARQRPASPVSVASLASEESATPAPTASAVNWDKVVAVAATYVCLSQATGLTRSSDVELFILTYPTSLGLTNFQNVPGWVAPFMQKLVVMGVLTTTVSQSGDYWYGLRMVFPHGTSPTVACDHVMAYMDSLRAASTTATAVTSASVVSPATTTATTMASATTVQAGTTTAASTDTAAATPTTSTVATDDGPVTLQPTNAAPTATPADSTDATHASTPVASTTPAATPAASVTPATTHTPAASTSAATTSTPVAATTSTPSAATADATPASMYTPAASTTPTAITSTFVAATTDTTPATTYTPVASTPAATTSTPAAATADATNSSMYTPAAPAATYTPVASTPATTTHPPDATPMYTPTAYTPATAAYTDTLATTYTSTAYPPATTAYTDTLATTTYTPAASTTPTTTPAATSTVPAPAASSATTTCTSGTAMPASQVNAVPGVARRPGENGVP